MKKNQLTTNPQTTGKKVKFAGVQPYVNPYTGEWIDMHVTDIEDRDFNFTKVWMRNFIATLDLVGNQKTRLSLWLIDNINHYNEINYTYREIANATGISLDTVGKTMKILQDVDFLRKVGKVYRINPDVLYKGGRGGRMALLQDYHQSPKKEFSRQEKIEKLQESIKKMQKQIEKLQAEDDYIDMEVEGQLAFNDEMKVVEKAVPVREKNSSRRKRK